MRCCKIAGVHKTTRGVTYGMCSVICSMKVLHAIQTAECSASALVSMAIQLLFVENIAAILDNDLHVSLCSNDPDNTMALLSVSTWQKFTSVIARTVESAKWTLGRYFARERDHGGRQRLKSQPKSELLGHERRGLAAMRVGSRFPMASI